MSRGWVSKLEEGLMGGADAVFANWPQKRPAVQGFEDFRLIAHRGCFATSSITENTIPAFQKAIDLPGVGVELDVRWTSDGEPVVFHDRSFQRVFKSSQQVEDLSFQKIRRFFPEVPHLREALDMAQGRHLMIELKDCAVDWQHGQQTLEPLLKAHCPNGNFHLISLNPAIFCQLSLLDPQHFLPIAKANLRALSAMALERQWGGVTSHYLMMTKAFIEKHHRAGQVVGVGFPSSLNSLYREYGRSVDYIFTNHAPQLWSQWSSGLPQ